MNKKKVVIIGSGNVATHLARGLAPECAIVQVYSRQLEHAQRLAKTLVGCQATSDLSALELNADVYIISVSDDAISQIAMQVPDNGALWLHTSGTIGLEVLKEYRTHCGVLYPMQSFSRELAVDWKQVHIFIEGDNEQSLKQINMLAHMLTEKVIPCDSEQRRILHVAAVFSCNFANHMWAQASSLLAKYGLPFDAMMPLIENTVEKLRHLTPAQSQTGPAQRGDRKVMACHMAMLEGQQREIYRLLSESIMETSNKTLIE